MNYGSKLIIKNVDKINPINSYDKQMNLAEKHDCLPSHKNTKIRFMFNCTYLGLRVGILY